MGQESASAPGEMVTRHLRVLIIGAGIAGIVAAIKLREAGIDDITIVEKAGGLGGTWRENTYPGITCDVPSLLYSYSFAPNPNWSHQFAPGAEIQAYLETVAADHGVTEMIRFNTEVTTLAYRPDGAAGAVWKAEGVDGFAWDGDVVFAATGVLHHPKYPDIEGLDDFEGPCFHSARWDHSVEVEGARIGIIGAGSTAVQIVTEIASRVGRLHVFQRTPQWVVQAPNDAVTDEERERYQRNPELMTTVRSKLAKAFEAAFADVVVHADSPELRLLEAACRENLESNVSDPGLRERLRPDYRAACKRLVVSPGYYEAVSRPNVSVVTEGIARVEPQGIRTTDGVLHSFDVLVLATGFRVDRFLRPIEVIGCGGNTIEQAWAERPTAYLGMAVPDFPNLFMLNGPNGPVGNFSLIEVSEMQVAYLIQLLDVLRSGEADEIEASRDATDEFETARVEAAKDTIWATGCRSWYLDDRGVPAAWPWTFSHYREVLSAPDLSAFELT
jgi:cation diffusion facilitator CzcD-associated flavoprotein CzcO